MRSIPMRALNQTTEQDSHYHLNSPLLFGVLKALDPESRIDLLDLTPATPELLDYFSDRHCRLYLPGCREKLLELHHQEEQDDDLKLTPILDKLIPLPADDSKALDIILLWDLPNYLDKRVLAGLISHLLPLVGKHSVLHTYIHTRQRMPERPATYRLGQDDKLWVDIDTAWNAQSPMYYQELLHKVLKPFRIERGMLLANGMQEYIFRSKS